MGIPYFKSSGLPEFVRHLCAVAAASLLALTVFLSSGCATQAARTAPSALNHDALMHSGLVANFDDTRAWQPWVLHASKRSTKYQRLTDGGQLLVRAVADRSASGLIHKLDLAPGENLQLSWRWKVDDLIAGADMTDRFSDDAPVRIVLAFDGDKTGLPAKEQAFMERMKLFTGQDLPYATLMYVWENRQPVGKVIHNPNTSRVRKIVASSGIKEIRRWQHFKRKVTQDFELAFGEKPGRLIGIALLTDTDNTGEKTVGYYADVKLE